MLFAFGKQLVNQIIFSGKQAADIINKCFGVGRQHKTTRVGNMFLNAFFFDLGKRETKFFLTGRNPATGRAL